MIEFQAGKNLFHVGLNKLWKDDIICRLKAIMKLVSWNLDATCHLGVFLEHDSTPRSRSSAIITWLVSFYCMAWTGTVSFPRLTITAPSDNWSMMSMSLEMLFLFVFPLVVSFISFFYDLQTIPSDIKIYKLGYCRVSRYDYESWQRLSLSSDCQSCNR